MARILHSAENGTRRRLRINRGLPAKLSCGVNPVVVVQASCGAEVLRSSSCAGVERVAVSRLTVVFQPIKAAVCIYPAAAYLREPCGDCSTVTDKLKKILFNNHRY